MRTAFYPFLDPEQAKKNEATQQYLDLIHQYDPGGNFLRIPDEQAGSLGGNRFFTLRKNPR